MFKLKNSLIAAGMILIFFMAFSLRTQIQAATYDCSAQTDISQAECEALVALYNSTDGANWNTSTNWLNANPCTWYGIECTNNHVTGLRESSNFLLGTIPPEIGHLTYLVDLQLQQNHLSGELPTTIGNLVNLQQLYLVGNQLSGSLPAEIGNLANLTYLNVASNELTGELPSTIWGLSNLTVLAFSENHFTGTLPAAIANLTKLQTLAGGWNKLSGNIPPEIGNLTKLKQIDLEKNNLAGSIPSEFGNLNRLESLYLYDNLLNGDIPPTFVNLISLSHINIHTNMLTASDPAVITFLNDLDQYWQANQTLTPTNVQAFPDASSPSVTISWVNLGISNYFEVGYSLTSGGPYTIKTSHINTLQINDLEGNTEYYFKVRTVTERPEYINHITEWSNEVSATTSGELTASATPTEAIPTATNTPSGEVPTVDPEPTATGTQFSEPLELLEPLNEAVIDDPAPQFKWTTYPGASTFRFRLSDSFDTTIVNESLDINEICGIETCQIELEDFDTVLENNEYYLWQISVNNGQYVSETFAFTTKFAVPGAFNLLAPTDSSNVNSSAPLFSWAESENAAEYRLRVLDSFDQRIINTTISSTTSPSVGDICQAGICTFDSSVLGIALEHNEDYEWNVRAKNTFGKKKALPFEFTVVLPLPGAFDLLTPLDNSNVETITPILTWEESVGATEYRVRIKHDFDDTTVFKVTGITPAICSEGICTLDTAIFTYLIPLETGESYLWKVQGRNSYGKQKSTQKLTFNVVIPALQVSKLSNQGEQLQLPSTTGQ